MKKKCIYLNLHILTSPPNGGVYRFAKEMLYALDNLIDRLDLNSKYTFIGILPNIAIKDPLSFNNIQIKKVCSISYRYIWEQLVLPIIVKDSLLINLCNFAPVFKKNQFCVIHDALIYKYPQSYSKKFVFILRSIYKLVILNAKYIATVSEFSKAEIIKYIGKPKMDIIVLGNSAENFVNYRADIGILKKLNLAKDKYILAVFSQKNSFYKNVDRFLKAINLVDFNFVCVGNVDDKYLYNSNKLTSIGYVTDSELKALYENAYCLVVPSLYEGFGIPPLEAMHCSCPVLSSNIPVFKEILGVATLYFDPNDEQDMAKTINYLIQNPSLRESLIVKGKAQVQNYRWQNIAEKLLENIIK